MKFNSLSAPIKCDCKDCSKRKTGCYKTCKSYFRYRVELERFKKQNRLNNDIYDYIKHKMWKNNK